MQERLSQVIETLRLYDDMVDKPTTVECYDADNTIVFAKYAQGVGERHISGDDASDDIEAVKKTFSCKRAWKEEKEYAQKTLEIRYVPVEDKGDVIGCIVTKVFKNDNTEAKNKAELFMECIDKINNAIDMMGIHFDNLFDVLKSMDEKTGYIEASVENTSSVVSKIKANASKSKILALNASIEAARSGEAGKGFTVVAKEMGEMASASGISASEINDALQEIFSHLNVITTSIGEANGFAEKQTGSVKEIEKYLAEAMKIADELAKALSE